MNGMMMGTFIGNWVTKGMARGHVVFLYYWFFFFFFIFRFWYLFFLMAPG